MKVFVVFLLLALVLPSLVWSFNDHHHNGRLLARRARASGSHQRFMNNRARLARYGRYAALEESQEQEQEQQHNVDEEPQQQQHEAPVSQQQQHNEPEQIEQVDVSGGPSTDFSAAPVQQERMLTTKAAPMSSSPFYGSFTQTPSYALETSTLRPTTTAQLQEEDIEQVRTQDDQQQQLEQTSNFGDSLGNSLRSDKAQSYGAGTAGARLAQKQQEALEDVQLAGMTAAGAASADQTAQEDEYNDNNADTTPMLRMNVRGEPGQDYPILGEVPETGFKCSEQSTPGYYADVEARCQVFHVCQDREQHQHSFLCPNGTIFSQKNFVCVWWFEFDCASAPQFYDLNAQLYAEVEGQPQPGGQAANAASSAFESAGPYAERMIDSAGPKLSSPKENLRNQMYGGDAAAVAGLQQQQQQVDASSEEIDDFGERKQVTAAAPLASDYSPRGDSAKARAAVKSMKSNGYEAVKSAIKETAAAYQTTPDSLNVALGDEIHSETPLIESLPLTTTLLPRPSGAKSSYSASTPSSVSEMAQPDQAKTDRLMDYYTQMSNGKSNGYGVPMVKGNRASQMASLPDSPVKNGRGGSAKTKAYGGRTGKASSAGLKW